RDIAVRPLDAAAQARAARLGGARVSPEYQLGVQGEAPQRERGLKVRNHLGAHPDLLPARLDQSGDSRRGGDRRSARIVAVKALPVVQEILGLVERTKNETELGRGDVCVR